MTQQSNTTNWVIHETGSGQPQMIKLVQSAGKSIGGIMTSAIAGQPVKIFKSPVSGQETRQIFTTTGTSQVIRATSAQKVGTKTVHLPLGTPKTIRLTPAQMQNLKLLKTQKIQIPQGATVVPVIQQSAIQTTASLKNFNSPPILDHSGSARKRHDPLDTDFAPESKRNRKNEKVSKGLRHFSMKVCDKVRKKGTTSYNEVAEELVEEFTKSNMNNSVTDQYDQKNIRRRVYDALNVLMAMKIISKEKKEIKWIGLPTNSWQECIQLEREKQKRIQSTREKMKQLQELIMNLIAFKNLSQRNKEMEASQGPPPPNSYIQLPFIVVNTNKKTVIDCCISNDKMEYLFQFNDKFEINDDVDILKSIGMLMGLDKGECTEENIERVKSLVPKSLREYVTQLATGTADQSINEILESTGQGPSNTTGIHAEDVVETQLDEDNSRQSSSFDPLSPAVEFSDEEGDSDISSDGEIN